jgi:hypothetical protein
MQPPVRILIDFRKPIDGASPALLAHLAQSAGVKLRYAAAISPRRYAYELVCPMSDPHCDAAITSLRSDPAVADVTPDRLFKLHRNPR